LGASWAWAPAAKPSTPANNDAVRILEVFIGSPACWYCRVSRLLAVKSYTVACSSERKRAKK
jgi:hypothetical protein